MIDEIRTNILQVDGIADENTDDADDDRETEVKPSKHTEVTTHATSFCFHITVWCYARTAAVRQQQSVVLKSSKRTQGVQPWRVTSHTEDLRLSCLQQTPVLYTKKLLEALPVSLRSSSPLVLV